ncbi:hypothetical protein [Niallia sp. FSL R7-0271]|uniref:hypothetical protein n=1 Tax=Niallia sp. FSL R7-0271 TaxID=2921678 RepID=UPI0030F67BCE
MEKQYDVFHRLERISERLDQASMTIRSSETDTKLKVKNWIFTWFLIPLHSLLDLKSLFKGIKSLDFSPALPVLASTILFPFLSFAVDTKWYILLVWGIIFGYIFSFVFVAPRCMCDFSGGYFRIGAYSLFRNQEYEIFKQSLVHDDENEFYFSSIPKQIQALLKSDENLQLIHTRIDTFLNQEKAELAQKIRVLEEKYADKEKELKQAIKEYDEEASNLLNASTEVHKAMGYLVDFLKATRLALLRKINKKLNIADIANLLGAGVSIFEVKDNHLRLMGEEQTTGDLPESIRFDDESYANSPFLDAAFNDHGESYEEIDENYFIITKRFPMKNEEVWIISFHVDAGVEKALFLSVGNDILEIKEVYKMIHSLCLLKQELELELS